MLRNDLSDLVARALTAPGLPDGLRNFRPEISDTKQADHGDFACNLALVASKAVGMNPRALGEALREAILAEDGGRLISEIEVAGPGFLNFRLKPESIAAYVPNALASGSAGLASAKIGSPKKINVEFVSVNPNGPITIGSGRGAAFGSTLCNVLAAAGNEVHREYYINDGVNSEQMRLFAESVAALLRGEPVPENGYKGDYVKRVAVTLTKQMFNALPDKGTVEHFIREQLPYYALDIAINQLLFSTKQPSEIWELINLAPKIHQLLKPDLEVILRIAGQIKRFATTVPTVTHGLNPNPSSVARILSISAFFIAEYLEDSRTIPAYVKPYHVAGLMPGYRTRIEPETYSNETAKAFAQAARRLRDLADSRDSDDVKNHTSLWIESIFDDPDQPAKVFFQTYDLDEVKERAQDSMIESQRRDLAAFGVEFDTWFSEQSLHDAGIVDQRLAELKANQVADEEPIRTKIKFGKGGVVEEVLHEPQETVKDEDDAEGSGKTLWLRSTKFGDDQDRVLKRRDGRLTYIASDVAYHADKFNRPANADKLITILGPDHHGYVGRLLAVVAALRKTADQTDEQALARAKEELEVVIFQLVRFLKDGKPAPMRKRDGNIYALIDLIREIGQAAAPNADQEEQIRIGRDVTRFFYLMRSHDTAMDFDLDLAARQSDENPVFYVQYAHARISSVLARGNEIPTGPVNLDLLAHPRESALIKKVLDLPWEVERCAADYGVHRLTTYAQELARLFHHFYDACRVIDPSQPELSLARLELCRLAREALRGALNLLGISAPERMERAQQIA